MTALARWTTKYLNYSFSDSSLLSRALTHRSVGGDNNERLEFLGDGFLNLAIAELLYELYPSYSEGDLSRLRASLVNGASLQEIAVSLELDQHIILSKAERGSGGARRASIIANAVEAIIGAVLLDGGYEAARRVVNRLYVTRLENLSSPDELKDPKTRLQEWLQARGNELPDYVVEHVAGAAHAQTFTLSVSAVGRNASADGTSRRGAEQEAARLLLDILRHDE
ncbi:MAG: ribonuclease III [Gammaproteobacteria bacterium]